MELLLLCMGIPPPPFFSGNRNRNAPHPTACDEKSFSTEALFLFTDQSQDGWRKLRGSIQRLAFLYPEELSHLLIITSLF